MVDTEITSSMVCRALHNMGYSDQDVEHRIRLWEMINHLGLQTNLCSMSLMDLPSDIILSWKIAGSKVTGLSTMHEGDIDIMNYLKGFLATDNPISNPYQDNWIVEMEYEDCPPGYCKLKYAPYDGEGSVGYKVFRNSSNSVIRQEKKIYIPHSYVKSLCREQFESEGIATTEKGPAFTLINRGRLAIDRVFAILSESVPVIVRRFGKNSALHLDHIVNNCEVVPVGYPGHTDESVLWRLSFSEAEKKIMQNLNGSQRKTHILMKKFIQEAVNTRFHSKVLSSYIVKLTILWMVEKDSKESWKESLIIERFLEGLQFIKECLDQGFFPHFFIVKRNMFVQRKRMTRKDLASTSSILSKYISEGSACISECISVYQEIIRFSSLIHNDVNANKPSKRLILEEIFSIMYLVMECVLHFAQFIAYYEDGWITTFRIDPIVAGMGGINEFIYNERLIGILLKRIARKIEKYDFSKLWHGRALKRFKKDLHELLSNKNMESVAGQVIFAVVVSAMEKYEIAYEHLQQTISRVESHPSEWIPLTTRGQYINERNLTYSPDCKIEMLLKNVCLSELMFNYDTAWLVPEGLSYQHFSDPDADVKDDINLIKVDCMALAYYLLAFVADQLGKDNEADLAIQKLIHGSTGNSCHPSLNFEYRETGLNLACHILIERRNYHSAFKIVRHSIIMACKMRSSPAPGILLLATLLRKSFEEETYIQLTRGKQKNGYLTKVVCILKSKFMFIPTLICDTIMHFTRAFRRITHI